MAESKLMAFRFKKSSCVVVGTFNMYILHPKWLAQRGIIERGAEASIETNFTQPGFRFKFSKIEVRWLITPSRVAVESSKPEVDCGAFVAKLLAALPETPLQGLGSNVEFLGDLGELATLSPAIRDFPQRASPRTDDAIIQRSFHIGVRRGEHEVTNLQLSITEQNVELACNLHVGLENRDDANVTAIAAAERYLTDRVRSQELAEHFFGAAILP